MPILSAAASRDVCPNAVRQLRTRREFSIDELARESGVSGTNIRRIESGEIVRPRMKTLRQLAKALDVQVTDLLLADLAA